MPTFVDDDLDLSDRNLRLTAILRSIVRKSDDLHEAHHLFPFIDSIKSCCFRSSSSLEDATMGAEAIVDKAMGGKFPESQIELTMES